MSAALCAASDAASFAIDASSVLRLLAILGGRGFQRQHARRRELGGHVGQHPLDRLVVGDRLAELLALLRVGDGLVERRLADAERLRRDRDASALQRPHREPEALVDAAEHLVVADGDVEIEIHAAETADARANRRARSA